MVVIRGEDSCKPRVTNFPQRPVPTEKTRKGLCPPRRHVFRRECRGRNRRCRGRAAEKRGMGWSEILRIVMLRKPGVCRERGSGHRFLKRKLHYYSSAPHPLGVGWEGRVGWGAAVRSTREVEPGRPVSSPESKSSSSSSHSSAGSARCRGLPQGREDCTFLFTPRSRAVTILFLGVFALRLRKLLLSRPKRSISFSRASF